MMGIHIPHCVYQVPKREVPQSTERQADIALSEVFFGYRISEHRQNQVRIRCKNCGGEINTRIS
jgi:hypothetical protein